MVPIAYTYCFAHWITALRFSSTISVGGALLVSSTATQLRYRGDPPGAFSFTDPPPPIFSGTIRLARNTERPPVNGTLT
jgi:hypothetical protein